MPFLLADDAADEATRRLQEFGQDQLSTIGGIGQGVSQTIGQGAQDLGSSAQDATQRLMQFGQQQLSNLQAPQIQAPPLPDVDAITGRLHAFGQQALGQATQATGALQNVATQAQQGIQQLQPLQSLNQPTPLGTTDLSQPGQQQQSQPQQDQPLDKNGVISYVQQKAAQFGLDPAAVLAVANQEGLNTDPGSHWQLPGEKNISFGPPSWYGNGAGADIIAQHGADAARWAWTPDGIDYWLNQVSSAAKGLTGDDAISAIVQGFERPREDLAAGEIAKAKQAYSQFVGGAQQAGSQALQTAQNVGSQAVQGAQGALGQVSQFGQQGLSDAEAYAACGPAAAVRFAQMFGRNPTLKEATDLAAQVGWTAASGMAGLSSEGSLFDKMGIDHRTIGPDWNALAKEASSGNPVVISTPGHYFTADAYDPTTGAFHVGQSGKDLRQGSEWMTPSQMEGLMGGLQGGLAVDNPGVSTPSPLSQAGNAVQQGVSAVANKAQQGLQALDANPIAQQVGQNIVKPLLGMPNTSPGPDLSQGIKPLTSAVADSLDNLAKTTDTIAPGGGGLVPSDAMRLGANFLRSPGVLDSMQTLQQLTQKYGTSDSSTYSGPDQEAANQALIAVGGVVSGGGGATAGTQGGEISAPYAAGLGGAAALGAGLLSQKDRIGDALQNFQAPTTLDDLKQNISDLGDKLEQYRQEQAASSPDVSFAAPVASGVQAVLDNLEQRRQDDISNQANFGNALLGDSQAMQDLGSNLQALMEANPQTSSAGDVSSPVSAGLTEAGVDPNVARVLGQVGNLVAPLAVEGGVARGLPDAAVQALEGESGALKLPGRLPTLGEVGDTLHAARIGALAGGIPTLVHIALNTPVQAGLRLANDVPADLLRLRPGATASEMYGMLQGLRAWGVNAATTLGTPGHLAASLGGGVGPQALETGLTGAVRLHPVLQDAARQLATQMTLYRDAANAATDAGLGQFTAPWRAEVARLVGTPTADMLENARFAGDRAALGGAIGSPPKGMGTTGAAVGNLARTPLGRFIAPIFNIGYHVATQGVETSPLGGLGTAWDVARGLAGAGPYGGPAGWAGRGANDAVTPLAERIRNNVIGLALAYEGYQQAAQGNITGEGPSDPGQQASLRQTGWQPDSIRIGGRYYDAHLLGPVGWSLIQGANAYEAMNGPGGQGLKPISTPQGERQPGTLDMLGDFTAREGRYFTNETFLNSMGSLLNLLGSSAQQGQAPANELANVLQSLVPQGALLSNLASSQDPYQRNARTSTDPIQIVQQALESRLPSNPLTPSRQDLVPRLSATGNPLPNPAQGTGLLAPRSSIINRDPILSEMQTLGITPTAPPKTVDYGPQNEVMLTPQEQQAWQTYRGAQLTRAASTLMNSTAYQKMSETAQRNAMAKAQSVASTAADKEVLADIVKSAPDKGKSRWIPKGANAPVYSYAPGGAVTDASGAPVGVGMAA